jgi:hypothetical protein
MKRFQFSTTQTQGRTKLKGSKMNREGGDAYVTGVDKKKMKNTASNTSKNREVEKMTCQS